MSVVTIDQYRAITHDDSSDDATVQDNLDQIEAIVEDFLDRPLALAERTEECIVYPKGRLFPDVTPIISVASPAGLINRGGYRLDGAVPFYDFLIEPLTYEDTRIRRGENRVELTYTAGWTDATIPETMKRMIARLAQRLNQAGTTAQFPAGATSVSLGDASISFAVPTGEAGELDTLLPGATRTLKKWKRRV